MTPDFTYTSPLGGSILNRSGIAMEAIAQAKTGWRELFLITDLRVENNSSGSDAPWVSVSMFNADAGLSNIGARLPCVYGAKDTSMFMFDLSGSKPLIARYEEDVSDVDWMAAMAACVE